MDHIPNPGMSDLIETVNQQTCTEIVGKGKSWAE